MVVADVAVIAPLSSTWLFLQSKSAGNVWTHSAPVESPDAMGGRVVAPPPSITPVDRTSPLLPISKHVLATDVPNDGLPRDRATVSSVYKELDVGFHCNRWISSRTGPNLRDVVLRLTRGVVVVVVVVVDDAGLITAIKDA